MRIPVAWLREYVDVPDDAAGLQAFADALTMAGLEVEEVYESPAAAGPAFYTKITPNRGDWASVYGTAREAAAAQSLTLRPLPAAGPGVALTPNTGEAGQFASVTIEDADACSRYAAKIVRGVTVGPSPAWMQDRLVAAGMRPVNNVVDVTNYVMLELGQPLHAFDLAHVPDGKIVVRQAREGETLTTLDGVERRLSPGVLCICGRDHPVAIAGVMGGGPTEVTAATTDILLESAHFDPQSVRRTSRRLALATEAAYRFERYVDPALVPVAAERAAQLLAETAGGTIVSGLVDVYAKRTPPRRVLARVDRIRKLLGANVERDAMIAGLERLGLSVERSGGALDVVVPSWRPDLTMEDDIAEEVGRIALGYENLPETRPPLRSGRGTDSPRGVFVARVRESLVRAGMQDVVTHSLTAPSPLATPDEARRRVMIRSALSPELGSLRTSLLPNLLDIVARAHGQNRRDIAVFEVAPVYLQAESGADYPYEEPLRVAGVVCGSSVGAAWGVRPDALPADFYYAKGVVEDLLAALGLAGNTVSFAPGTHPITHPGRTATVSVGGEAVGIVAELSEAIVNANDLPRRTYVFDLNGDALRRLSETAGQSSVRFSPLPRFPAALRDLAPVFSSTVSYADVERVTRHAAGPLLEDLSLVDVYQGANLGENRQALTLRLLFRSPERTLKDAEIEQALATVRARLQSELGADLRA